MKPKRFKGYWRALKQKKEWAISLSKKGAYRASVGWLFGWTYDEELIKEMMYKSNSLLSMIPKGDSWSGGYLPVPFKSLAPDFYRKRKMAYIRSKKRLNEYRR